MVSNSGEGIRIEGTTATVTLAGRGKGLMLEAALDKRLPDDMKADDHVLLDAFVRRIAEDLTNICNRGLEVHRGTSGQTISFVLMLAGSEICKLVCDRQAVIAQVKSRLGAPAIRSTSLTDRRIALGPTSVQLEGILGGVDLALDDLENLVVGDVLILDRDIDSPIPVRIRTNGMYVGRGALGQNNRHPMIAF